MATTAKLELAVKLLRQLEAGQSQGALISQAADCAPVVEALGYYDLADHLRRMSDKRSTRGYMRGLRPGDVISLPDTVGFLTVLTHPVEEDLMVTFDVRSHETGLRHMHQWPGGTEVLVHSSDGPR